MTSLVLSLLLLLNPPLHPPRTCDLTEEPLVDHYTQHLAMAWAKQAHEVVSDQAILDIARRFGSQLDCSRTSTDRARALCPLTVLSNTPFPRPIALRWYQGYSFDIADDWSIATVGDQAIEHTELLLIGPRSFTIAATLPENECDRLDEQQRIAGVTRRLVLAGQGPQHVGVAIYAAITVATDSLRPKQSDLADPFEGTPWRVLRVQNPTTGEDVYVVVTPFKGGYRISLFPIVELIE